jgi:hypothetical protein
MKKNILIALILLTGIAGSVWYAQKPPHAAEVPIPPAAPSSKPLAEQTIPAPKNCESATLVVASSTPYEACVEPGDTVLALMRRLGAQGLSFSGKEYPSLGFFVESINGKESADGLYWFLYINGESSDSGASSANVAPGDAVEWRYKKY